MPHSREPKTAVALLDTREHTSDHEHAVQLKLADGLAQLLNLPRAQLRQPPTDDAHYYYLATDTLIDPARYAPLGIHSERDLFGGLVSHPYMATKAISHPCPPGKLPAGLDGCVRPGCQQRLAAGYTVFSKDDARRAAACCLPKAEFASSQCWPAPVVANRSSPGAKHWKHCCSRWTTNSSPYGAWCWKKT
jgi:hypothetical protein